MVKVERWIFITKILHGHGLERVRINEWLM